jgi:hypothetical protein
MWSWPELQAAFRDALLADDERAVAAQILDDDLGAPARLAVYRHHVFTSLTAALEATFPVVCRLVDRRFFGWLADRYIREHPPAGPCLFEYGGGLPDFIAAFPACAGLPYLADVARLEWAMNVALHAPDATALGPEALGQVAPWSVLRLHPSMTLLSSRWPIGALWLANQPGADTQTVDLRAGGVRLEVRRVADDVVFRALSERAFAFRLALGGGASLEAAVERALVVDHRFDLASELRALFEGGLVVGTAAGRPSDAPQRPASMRSAPSVSSGSGRVV